MAIYNSYKPEFYLGRDQDFDHTLLDSCWRRDKRYQVQCEHTYPICDSPEIEIGGAHLRFVTEIESKSPFSCVNRSPLAFLPYARESKRTALDSGFHIVDSAFFVTGS